MTSKRSFLKRVFACVVVALAPEIAFANIKPTNIRDLLVEVLEPNERVLKCDIIKESLFVYTNIGIRRIYWLESDAGISWKQEMVFRD